MKQLFLSAVLLFVMGDSAFCQKMQATIKPGTTPRTIDIYLKPSASFSQKDEAMTFVLAIPATVTPAPKMGSSGVTQNTTGAVTGITGLQPAFLVDSLGSTSREIVVSTQTINGVSYYIYTFIFSGTAAVNHNWVAGVEQLIFSIQFNGCTNNCDPANELLVNLANGGANSNAYFYFQPNVLGDITNYPAPFYANPQSSALVNGGSSQGSALSTIGLATPVSLPIKLSAFNAKANACNANISWQTSEEMNAAFYSVERSDNGSNFLEIGRIAATAQINGLKSYSFIDNTGLPGALYYRLRLVDKDGRFSYSSVKEIDLNCSGKANVIVYPTLTTGLVNIKLPSGSENARIRVMNSIGKEVASDVNKTQNRALDLKRFSDGAYFIQINSFSHRYILNIISLSLLNVIHHLIPLPSRFIH